MNILQCGVPKSGNFWLYKIIRQILERDGRNTTSFIEQHPIYSLAREWELNFPEQAKIDVLEVTDLQYSYRISSIFQMPIDNIRHYVSKSPHIWTHSPVCERSGELFELLDKKVCVIRDPRDRVISASKYYCSDYMLKYFPQEETDPEQFLNKNFDRLMHEWVWHVYDYLRLSRQYGIHIVFFEGFLQRFHEELSQLLEYLNINLDDHQKQELEEAVSFKTLKKKNPRHLKKGESGYWMGQLSDEHLERAEIIAGPLIRFLGYPVERGQPMTFSADIEWSRLKELKEEILASQKRLYTSNSTIHQADVL